MKNFVHLARRLRALRFRLQPEAYWRSYGRNARALGYDRLYAIFSFDCDTDEDIPAALAVHRWLSDHGQQGVFAVPGAQLKKGAAEFKSIAAEGAEFINHGGAPHAEKRGDRYWSVNFYDQIGLESVEADIVSGHELYVDVLGQAPIGFRAPHFGHYQTKENLRHLYSVLKRLGYRYASTTLPAAHRQFAPHLEKNGLLEFPLSGRYARPLQVFDSWSYLKNPETQAVGEHYGEDMLVSVKRLHGRGTTGVLNYYSDPAHVSKSKSFFDALQYCIDTGIVLTTFSGLIKALRLSSQ